MYMVAFLSTLYYRHASKDPNLEIFIKDHELHLMTELRFHIVVHHPLRPLKGLVMDLLQASRTHGEIGATITGDALHSAAEKTLDEWMHSDLLLLYPPSQIALAALQCAGMTCQQQDIVSTYISGLCSDIGKTTQLLQTLEDVKVLGGAGIQMTEEKDIKTLLGRLQSCRNPLMDPTSAIYIAQQKEKEEALAAERTRRQEEWKNKEAAMQAQIFGK
eukprot:m.1183251 g.1183251  ORF g.1183251 m.1183251 type:complete len:217 (-) comp24540_c1_seq41:702-1352(-)